MASPADVRAGGASIEVSATTDKLKAGLASADKQLRDFGAQAHSWSLKTAATIGAGFFAAKAAIGGAMNAIVTYGDHFDKMAQRTGIGVEALSEFEHMAGLCGTSIETFEASIRTMEKGLSDAALGTGEAKVALDSLGIKLSDINTKNPDEAFKKLAAAVAEVDDPSKRAALAMKLFGESGVQLLPLFNAGADGMDKMAQAAHELGIAMTGEEAEAAAALGDAISSLKQSFFGVVRTVLSEAVPSLTKFTNILTDGMKKVIEFVSNNKKLVENILVAGTTFLTVTAAVLGATKAIAFFSTAITALTALNPTTLAIIGIAGAATAAALAFKNAGVEATNASTKMADAAKKHREEYTKDNSLMSRLEEIAKKHHKTNDEIKEAQAIVEQLKNNYGDLGISVDAATGKINGLNGAQERMNKLQLQMKQNDVQAEISEQQANATKYQSEIDAILSSNEEGKKSFVKEAWETGKNYVTGEQTKTFQKDGKWYSMSQSERDQLRNAQAGLQNAQQQIGIKQNQLKLLGEGVDIQDVEEKAKIAAAKQEGASSEPADKLSFATKEEIKREISVRQNRLIFDDVSDEEKTRLNAEISRRKETLESGEETAAQKDTRKSEEEFRLRTQTEHEKNLKKIADDFNAVFAKRVEELIKKGYSEDSAKEMAKEELTSAEANRDALIHEENQRFKNEQIDAKINAAREEAEKRAQQDEEIKNSTLSESEAKLAELNRYEGDLQLQLQAAVNRGDNQTTVDLVNEINAVRDERKETEDALVSENLQSASERFAAASEALSVAYESGDKDAIESAAKEREAAAAELNAARSAQASLTDDLVAQLREGDVDEYAEEIDSGNQEANVKYSSMGSFSSFDSSNVGQDYDKKIADYNCEQVRLQRRMTTLLENPVAAATFG